MSGQFCNCMISLRNAAGGVKLVGTETICQKCNLATKKIQPCECMHKKFEPSNHTDFDELCTECGLPSFQDVRNFEKLNLEAQKVAGGTTLDDYSIAREQLRKEKEEAKAQKEAATKAKQDAINAEIAKAKLERSQLIAEYENKKQSIPVEARLQIALLEDIKSLLEQAASQSGKVANNTANTAARLPALAAGLLALSMDE